jgi:DNA polymerase
MKAELSIDIETYSPVSLKDCGVYKYCEHKDFEIVLCSYSLNSGAVETIELPERNKWPVKFVNMLTNPSIIKTAHNAMFEFVCLNSALNESLKYEQWECTMVKALMCGLPGSLDKVSEILQLKEKKDKRGSALIRLFCTPDKFGMRIEPDERREDWIDFIEYNRQDVTVEAAVKRELSYVHFNEFEREVQRIDSLINATGILMDVEFIDSSIESANIIRALLSDKIKKLTGVKNPGSVEQIKQWLRLKTGEEVKSIKKAVHGETASLGEKLYTVKAITPEIKTVLDAREEHGRSSVKKYNAMRRVVMSDGRVRGTTQYGGAGRTLRWAGRLIQPQNFLRNNLTFFGIDMLDTFRQTIKEKNINAFLKVDKPMSVLGQLTRTAIIAPPGKTLLITDFSSIEACITAWLSQEQWRLEAFNNRQDIYLVSAARMLKLDFKTLTKESKERWVGKWGELSLGFGGGVGALLRMGALEAGMNKKDLPDIVRKWRKASPKVVKFWSDMYTLAVQAIRNKGKIFKFGFGILFQVKEDMLWIRLPSGRYLMYREPRIKPVDRFNNGHISAEITYMGVNSFTKKWERLKTYGGKIAENIIQATARDLLANGICQLHYAGYKIVLHVHDEIVMEVDKDKAASNVIKVNKIMSAKPDWAEGCPVYAASFISEYYKKD